MRRRVEGWEVGRAVTQFMKSSKPYVSHTLRGMRISPWAIRKFIVKGK